jgi:glycosyltransferase involved in cell wall biosynthesis
MEKISLYTLTFNNERTIERCLKSVQWADEIVVVDHYSTGRTPKIFHRCNERFYQLLPFLSFPQGLLSQEGSP